MADGRIRVTGEAVLPFRQALYNGSCPECGEELPWEADFDADGTTYHAHCCGYMYSMRPHSVTVDREPEEDEEGED